MQRQGVIPTLGSRSGDAVCSLYLPDVRSQDHGELSGEVLYQEAWERLAANCREIL